MIHSDQTNPPYLHSGIANPSNGGPNQMARAWAVALLRRNGEELTEENISRVLETRPTFASIARKPKPSPAPPPEPNDTGFSPISPPVRDTADDWEKTPSFRTNHMLHDPETAMARAWATVQLRHSGETITEENIQRVLAAKNRLQTKQQPPTSEDFTEFVRPAALPHQIHHTGNDLAEKIRQVQELHDLLEQAREREQADSKKISTLHSQLKETETNLEAAWKQKLAEFETRERELALKLEEKTALLEQRSSENIRLAAELGEKSSLARKADEELAILRGRIHTHTAEQQMLERELEEKNSTLARKESELAALQQEVVRLQSTRANPVPQSPSADRVELERLRLLVSELSGFARDPGIECRKVLIETLENELTICLQREAVLRAKSREFDSGTDFTQGWSRGAEDRKNLEASIGHLRRRIDALSTLLAEALAFLQRKEGIEAPDQGDGLRR